MNFLRIELPRQGYRQQNANQYECNGWSRHPVDFQHKALHDYIPFIGLQFCVFNCISKPSTTRIPQSFSQPLGGWQPRSLQLQNQPPDKSCLSCPDRKKRLPGKRFPLSPSTIRRADTEWFPLLLIGLSLPSGTPYSLNMKSPLFRIPSYRARMG